MHGAALREIGFIAGIERVDIVAGAFAVQRLL